MQFVEVLGFMVYSGFIGIMEKKMETTGIMVVILGLYRGYIYVVYRGFIMIMEKKMETTVV